MPEMTPEKLREFIENGCSARPEDKHDALVGVSTWEADRKQAEEANKTWVKMWQEEHDQCVETLARIEALEEERHHYRSNVDRWAEEVAARDTRIEALDGLMRFAPTVGYIIRAGCHRLAKVIDEETTDEEKTALIGFEEELAALAAEEET